MAERKKLLIKLCAGTDRGKSVTPETAVAIEEQVREIEAQNTIKDTAVAPGLTGRVWSSQSSTHHGRSTTRTLTFVRVRPTERSARPKAASLRLAHVLYTCHRATHWR